MQNPGMLHGVAAGGAHRGAPAMADLHSYFLGLEPENRAAVVSLRDAGSATVLRRILDIQSSLRSSSPVFFCFEGLEQNRGVANYGEWTPLGGSREPADSMAMPPAARLVVQQCPGGVDVLSPKLLDASTKLDKLLRLDCCDTLSIPWYGVATSEEAGKLFKCLSLLAPLADARTDTGEKNQLQHGACRFFTAATLAASLLMQQIMRSQRDAHREAAAVKRPTVNISNSSVARPMPMPAAARSAAKARGISLGKLMKKLDASDDAVANERLEIECVKVVLRRMHQTLPAVGKPATPVDPSGGWAPVHRWANDWSALDPKLERAQVSAAPTPPGSLSPSHREREGYGAKDVAAWVRPTILSSCTGMGSICDQVDALGHLLDCGTGYGPIASRWKQRSRRDGKAYQSALDLLFSAPLAHVPLHASLFAHAPLQTKLIGEIDEIVDELRDGLKRAALRQKHPLPRRLEESSNFLRSSSGAAAGRSSRSPLSYSVPDLWPARGFDAGEEEPDSLIRGHDQEWTQLGRHHDAMSEIEARFSAGAGAGRYFGYLDEADAGGGGKGFDGKACVEAGAKAEVRAVVKTQPAAPLLLALSPGMRREAATTPEERPLSGSRSSTDLRQEKVEEASLPVNSSLGLSESESESGSESESEEESDQEDGLEEHPPQTLVRLHTDAAGLQECALSEAGKAEHDPPESAAALPQSLEANAAPAAEQHTQGALISATEAAAAAIGIPFYSPPQHCRAPSPAKSSSPEPSAGKDSSPSPERLQGGSKSPSRDKKTVAFNPLQPQYPPFESLPAERRTTARRLHVEIEAFLAENKPTAESRRQRQLIVDEVRAAVKACWEDAALDVYGSFSTDLFLPHSDVDLVVSNATERGAKSKLLLLADQLRSMQWCRSMNAIETASVPVIKLAADVSHLERLDRARSEKRERSEPPGAAHDAASPSEEEGGSEEEAAQAREGRAEEGGVLGGRVAGDVSQGPGCIPVDVTFHDEEVKREGVAYAPIMSRNFVCEEMLRFPIIKPLVFVLKHFLYCHEFNDAYTGGLSSHSLIVLLIFYFQYLEKNSEKSSFGEAGDDVPEDCRLGEWLMRTMQWLAEFPFDHVGISVGSSHETPTELVGLTRDGVAMCKARVVKKASGPGETELFIFDPFHPNVNIARSSFRWWQVRQGIQGGVRILAEHREAAPTARIFGGVPQSSSPLASIFTKGLVLKAGGKNKGAGARVRDSLAASVGFPRPRNTRSPEGRGGDAPSGTWAKKAAAGRGGMQLDVGAGHGPGAGRGPPRTPPYLNDRSAEDHWPSLV